MMPHRRPHRSAKSVLLLGLVLSAVGCAQEEPQPTTPAQQFTQDNTAPALRTVTQGLDPTIVVNSTLDNLVAADGACTLREAVRNANASADLTSGDCSPGNASDVIDVPAGNYVLSIAGRDENAAATGDLDLTGDVTLQGAGADLTVIDANGIDRVFQIIGDGNVIEGVTITGGSAEFAGACADGWESNGGSTDGGGLYGSGSTITLNRVRVTGNAAQCNGGGMMSIGGTLKGTDVLFDNNMAGNEGGGFSAIRSSTDGINHLYNWTISSNDAANRGGGIVHSSNCCALKMNHFTVTANTAGGDGGGVQQYGFGMSFYGSIIAGNISPNTAEADCGDNAVGGHSNLFGENGSTNGCAAPSCGSRNGVVENTIDTVLEPVLSDNGGTMPSHALVSGSPAIDHVERDADGVPDGNRSHCGTSLMAGDQLGVTREARCDAGATEFGSVPQALCGCDGANLVCPAALSCNDEMQGEDETDVDCGGSLCSPCGDFAACAVDSDCAHGLCADSVCATKPVIAWMGGPATAGIDIGNTNTYPEVAGDDGFSLAGLTIADVGSGLASVSIVIDGAQTLLAENYMLDPMTGIGEMNPQSGFTCTPGACPMDNVTFNYSQLGFGPHCAVLTVTNAAGNTNTENICFNRVLPELFTLDDLANYAEGLCTQLDLDMSPYVPADIHYQDALDAVAICNQGVACLNAEPTQMGCFVLAMVNTHKLTLNVERDVAPDVHLDMRELVVDVTEAALIYTQDQVSDSPIVSSLDQGALELALVQNANSTSDAMNNIETTFFWFDDARQPYPALAGSQVTCGAIDTILQELGAYATDDDDLAAADEVAAVYDTMLNAKELLCSNLTFNEPCYDQNFLRGITGLMDSASDLKRMRNAGNLGEGSNLVWTRNWQLGISRVAQVWLNDALGNLDEWREDGGLAVGYELIQQQANASWGEAEDLLDVGELDAFIGRFTDPAAKCLMYDAYEYVNNWWDDAQNPQCQAIAYPPVCFDGEGDNEWPLHQVPVAGLSETGQIIAIPWSPQVQTDVGTELIQANPGDVLRFNFTGNHDLYMLPDAAAYAACDFTDATKLSAAGPVFYAATSQMTAYFASTPPDCDNGMKLILEVNEL